MKKSNRKRKPRMRDLSGVAMADKWDKEMARCARILKRKTANGTIRIDDPVYARMDAVWRHRKATGQLGDIDCADDEKLDRYLDWLDAQRVKLMYRWDDETMAGTRTPVDTVVYVEDDDD